MPPGNPPALVIIIHGPEIRTSGKNFSAGSDDGETVGQFRQRYIVDDASRDDPARGIRKIASPAAVPRDRRAEVQIEGGARC